MPSESAFKWLRNTHEDQILLADCEALARNALEITIELRDDIGFIDANALLGRVLRERGHLEAAIAAFDSAASRLEALVSSQSNLTDLDGQQASVHTDWGRALMDRGQYEEALAHFETSKAIHEERHRRATGEDKLIESQDLATAYVDLGDLLSWTSRSSDAEELYARALGLLEESRAAGRKSLQLKQNIARLRLRLHDVLTLRGEVDGAAQQLGAAEELSRELVREEPDHFGWKTDLADVQARRSQFSYERGRLEEVEGYLDAAVDTYSGLADRDPTRTIWREGLAVLRSALARLRERQERYVESAQEYAGSRDILEKLSAADPERVAWKLSIASTQQDIALLAARILGILPDDQRDLAFLESMILNAKRARDTVKEIAGRDVGNVRRRDDLANAEWVVARVLRTCADCIDAGMEIDLPEGMSAESLRNSSLQIYAASADNLKELLAQEPEQIYRRWALVDSVTGAAAVLEELGRHEDAIRLQRLALVPVEALVARDPENQTWNSKLASVREAISRLEKQMSSHPVLT